ncbi:21267_t:CDS:2, partial [Gigaspora rosea]
MESNVCHYGECIECGGANSGSNCVWLEGPRYISDNESQEWIRSGPTTCALKRIENSQFICQEYLDN